MTERAVRVVEPQKRPVTLLDSCVLIDIATDNPKWAQWSDSAVSSAFDDGPVVINPIIYAEVSIGYDNVEDLDAALPASDYGREPLPYAAGFLAGKAFLGYRRRGGQRRSPLPDFYIGAHAAVRGYRLLTRDTSRYRTYFPRLEIISPS
jgi:hypothetical protein